MHLLVIEDDERLGRVLKRLLEEDRHVVDVATDGETGLDLAESDGIDVVILDVGLQQEDPLLPALCSAVGLNDAPAGGAKAV